MGPKNQSIQVKNGKLYQITASGDYKLVGEFDMGTEITFKKEEIEDNSRLF